MPTIDEECPSCGTTSHAHSIMCRNNWVPPPEERCSFATKEYVENLSSVNDDPARLADAILGDDLDINATKIDIFERLNYTIEQMKAHPTDRFDTTILLVDALSELERITVINRDLAQSKQPINSSDGTFALCAGCPVRDTEVTCPMCGYIGTAPGCTNAKCPCRGLATMTATPRLI